MLFVCKVFVTFAMERWCEPDVRAANGFGRLRVMFPLSFPAETGCGGRDGCLSRGGCAAPDAAVWAMIPHAEPPRVEADGRGTYT